MADYVLHLAQEENIVLGAGIVRRLIEGGSGDAALLYLCLARRGSSEPEQLRAELRWSEAQFAAAERALCAMGLVNRPSDGGRESAPAREAPAAPETAIPEYSREDVMGKLESDDSFASLLREVERKLGRLSDPSVKKLLGLYDYLGFPAEVIFLLVNYCAERKTEQFGALKPPTMREIEKEGYVWARRELFSVEAADAYIRSERKKRRSFPDYMAALQLGDRAPSPGEERYLGAWSEMGFPAETVAIAYDKTVLKCREFKWPYCNGILKRWHEKGLHKPDEVKSENAPARARSTPAQSAADRNAWMKDYD
ncbi:MAG: DNA replication protein DnaD [Ruminococcaceae bacterium]|nr:DNA replication protein DnaD [Oscillospiraceae bacterium]